MLPEYLMLFLFFQYLYFKGNCKVLQSCLFGIKKFYFIFCRVRYLNLIILTRTMFRPFPTDVKLSPSKRTNESSTQTRKGSRTFTKITTSTTWQESMTPSSGLSVLKEESLLLNNIQPNVSTQDLYFFCHH